MGADDFIASLLARAARARRRVAFAEGNDPRVLAAAAYLAAEGILTPVLIIDPAGPPPVSIPPGCEVVDLASDPRRERLAIDVVAARAPRAYSPDEVARYARHPVYFADDMLRHGEVDGTVSGCVFTTADVLRAALLLIGPAHGVRTISSAFYMVAPPFRADNWEVLTFADCAVVPHPTAEELADIAVAAARDRPRLVGDVPLVAFLSFSTRGSGMSKSVVRVRDAAFLARQREPAVAFDGELQSDAALMAAVAARKAPDSPVAGRANVLIFPSLDAANIAYKLVERVGRARAIGPIVQGLRLPCNDLSRGASSNDIITVAAVTALQAGEPPA